MKRNRVWTLSALLVLQLIAAVMLTINQNTQVQSLNEGPLLAFNADQVDRIMIEESGQPALEISKQNGEWKLPGYFGLAAQDGKLNELLQKLQNLQRGWPVATTEATAKRFEVTADKHQRRIKLMQGDTTLATLFMGTSPEMRKTHVRADGESDVYALAINHFDAPSRGQDWVEGLLQVDTAALDKIQGTDFTLVRSGDDWQLEGLTEQESTDEDAVRNLLTGLGNLRFMEALGTEATPDYRLDHPALRLSLQGGNEVVDYRFGKPDNADYYVLKRSNQALYLKIPAGQLEPMISLKRASFAKIKPETIQGEPDEMETEPEKTPEAAS